jgi:hypothetical protein
MIRQTQTSSNIIHSKHAVKNETELPGRALLAGGHDSDGRATVSATMLGLGSIKLVKDTDVFAIQSKMTSLALNMVTDYQMIPHIHITVLF